MILYVSSCPNLTHAPTGAALEAADRLALVAWCHPRAPPALLLDLGPRQSARHYRVPSSKSRGAMEAPNWVFVLDDREEKDAGRNEERENITLK